ncbi:MAG: DNA topoisomerase I [Candidatus Bathyarchaeota archaeon]|nr:MAG: DNA topoisomerase I [Candidatus Bathyarchaeota archaeon]
MGYTLIIAEKREAARRIAHALDDNGSPTELYHQRIPYFEAHHDDQRILVISAIGHVYTIAPERYQGFTYPIFDVQWAPMYQFNKKAVHTKQWIEMITTIAEHASTLISGTDYDTEGEVIGYTILKYACEGREQQAKRMRFSTLTTEELREAYGKLAPTINFGLAAAGETRHIVDFLWGINLSRAFTLAVKNTSGYYAPLSTGRVQAPTLKIVIDREEKIQSFVPIPYWKIRAQVKLRDQIFDVEYSKPKIDRESHARYIIEACVTRIGILSDITTNTRKLSPPTPFNIGTLQREAFRLFRSSPSQTLRAAEQLYLAALISYPRTGSERIPSTVDVRRILTLLKQEKRYAQPVNRLLAQPKLIPTEGQQDDPAHPAIYPTGNLPPRRLPRLNQNIYDLIVKRFMALFGAPAIQERVKLSITIGGETFYLRGLRILQPGWLTFYTPYERSRETILPKVSIGEQIHFNSIQYEEKYTTPPSRYNASSLLQRMEAQDIGTKATRAETIDTLFDRGYLMNEQITVTELGYKIVNVLETYCKQIVSVEFTRSLEERMNNIEAGSEKQRNVIQDTINTLRDILSELKHHEEPIGYALSEAVKQSRLEKHVVGPCPICKTGRLIVLTSNTSGKRFVGCTNFRKNLCTASFPLPQPPYRIKILNRSCRSCSWPTIAVRSPHKRAWNLCLNPTCPTKNRRNR